ncbi:MAG: isocitrate lyase/PEP mutase family protein [Rhizobiales bacterium]|nr:isocitrate lyase/PEP mutase family protein [Hyphomicrobiales bacterium]
MRRTTRFRHLVEASDILMLPAVHDALGARIAEKAGFDAITSGGYAASATLLGKPDTSQLSLTEMADYYARLCDATGLPVFADGDTGFGNPTNVARTVRLYEKAGVAGLFIEDQVFPKRCGHMAGKAVVPIEEFLSKIGAALDSRQDPDLVIMARTDALAVHGLEDAIERAALAREAGADLLFVEAPGTLVEMRRICAELDGPCLANNLDGGQSPVIPAKELEAIGYAVVAYATAATYAVAHALQGVLSTIREHGAPLGWGDRMFDFERFNDLVGLGELRSREQAHLDFATKLAARGRISEPAAEELRTSSAKEGSSR